MIDKDLPFEETLDDDDFGLIISKHGDLKGVWIPDSVSDEEIPDVIVELCMHFFGVDPNDDDDPSTTVH